MIVAVAVEYVVIDLPQLAKRAVRENCRHTHRQHHFDLFIFL